VETGAVQPGRQVNLLDHEMLFSDEMPIATPLETTMNSRHLTALFAQRASKALSVAALAVGLTATVLAPSSALAAPITVDRGPSYSPDLVATFTAGEPQVPGARIGFYAIVKNEGFTAASPVRMNVTLPSGFTNIQVTDSGYSTCSISGQTVSCGVSNLPAGEPMGAAIVATAPANRDSYSVTVVADPGQLVKEGRETNNTVRGTLVVY
jgi:CARDB